METVALKVNKREKNSVAKRLRSQGILPGICYGSAKDNIPVQMDYQTFRKAFIKAGKNTIIDLDVDGEGQKVLVHDVQFDPLLNTVSHVDFLLINMKENVTTNVPVKFVGEAPAVKDLQGILNVSLDEIEVRCLPANIPHEFNVDISVLVDFHSVIHVKDIKVDPEVEVLNDPEDTVVAVVPPRVEEEAPVELTPEEQEKAAIEAAAGPEPEKAVSEKEKKVEQN